MDMSCDELAKKRPPAKDAAEIDIPEPVYGETIKTKNLEFCDAMLVF